VRREFFYPVLIVSAALLGGCGGAHNAADSTAPTTAREPRPSFAGKPSPTFPRRIAVSFDGQRTAADVAFLLAIEKGFFEDVGLRVSGGDPVRPRRPVRYISAYTDDFALTQQPQVAMAKDKGAPIVAVGSLVSQPTAAMIWLKGSGIRGIADLENKTIATPGIPYQEKMLEVILERAGLKPDDVKVKHFVYKLPLALLKGKADAIFGGSWNIEGAALRERGVEPVIKRVQELGVPAYDELVVITRSDRAAREPWVVRKFMRALMRGVAAVRRNPEIAASMLATSPHEFVIGEKVADAQMRATLPLLSRTGYFDPGQAEELLTWMHDEGMIRGSLSASALFTNKYVSGGK
jgi:ABC-type nitrate/sulfonate/bicarbonate transport system substrate-binding protein